MLTQSSDGTDWSSEPVVVPGLVEGMQATVADLTLADVKARLLCTLGNRLDAVHVVVDIPQA